jgi:hypothetical protein
MSKIFQVKTLDINYIYIWYPIPVIIVQLVEKTFEM